jgi:adenylate cyclase
MGKKCASGAGQKPNNPAGAVPAATGEPETVAPNRAPLRHGHGHHPHIEFKFFEELKQRNVVRVALLYLVACWLILDPVHVVFHMLEVPAWANRLVLILMAIGFPAVLLFAWAFEITPEGLKPTVEVDPQNSIRSLTGRRLDRAIIVVLALALAYFVVDKFWLAKREAVSEGVTTVSPPTPSTPTGIAAPEKSIAVLPFVDMSEKKDQEYFADGMAEQILELLSKVPELHVPARTSSFYFKGKQATIADIAKALNVAHLLEGSVRKSGNTLRITVQLVRADNGYHLWSETYDRKLDDIFKVQDEIASAVVKALKVSLLANATPQAIGTENVDAYTTYLQAKSISVHTGAPRDWEKVAEYLQQALKLDPTFAQAWALLSLTRAEQAARRFVPSQQGWEDARHAARRALELDPRLPEAHTAMAKIQIWHDFDWAGAQAQVQQAQDVDPGNHSALRFAGTLAGAVGQADKAVEYYQRVIATDPLDAPAYGRLGLHLFEAARFTEAQAAVRKSLDLNPGALYVHNLAGLLMLVTGEPTEALLEFERENDAMGRLFGRAIGYQALGRKAEADSVLADLEKNYAETGAYLIARVHAYRGEIDQAFAWLNRAYRQRDFFLTIVKNDPLLKNLRPDPRYEAFLRTMNLPE